MSSVRAKDGDTMMIMRRIGSFCRRHALAMWLVVVPLLTVVLLVRHWTEVGQIAEALSQAHPRWIAVGVGIELGTIVASALTYRVLLRRLGHPLSCLTLAGAHLRRGALGALFFLNGPASVYVFIRILKQRHVPVDDGLLTVALRSVAGQVAFIVILVAVLAIRGANHALAVVGVLLAAGVAFAPLFRSRWQWRMPCLGRLPFSLEKRAATFMARLRGHRLAPRDLAWPVALMLLIRAGPIGLLFASLHALDVETTFGVVITAYLAAVLAHTMVPLFQGAGVVEAAAAVALTQSGVPAETAIGVALVWRLMDFWMVFAAGLALHALASLGPRFTERPVAPARSPRPSSAGFALRTAPSPVPVPAFVAPRAATGVSRSARHGSTT
ncbi:MAG: lysylphosphatidylglycerol synthase transmembrane domain-containing protein [Thermomicrobiales bacterium]